MPTERPLHHHGAMHYDGGVGAGGEEQARAGPAGGEEYYPNLSHQVHQRQPQDGGGQQMSSQQRQQQQQLLYEMDHRRQQQHENDRRPTHVLQAAQQTAATFIANLMTTTAGGRDEAVNAAGAGMAIPPDAASHHRYEYPGLATPRQHQPLLHQHHLPPPPPPFGGHHHQPGAATVAVPGHPSSYFQQHQHHQQLEYQHQQLENQSGVLPQHEQHRGSGSAGHGRDIYHRSRMDAMERVGRPGAGGAGRDAAASSAFAPVAPAPQQQQRPHPAAEQQLGSSHHHHHHRQTIPEGTIPASALDLLAAATATATATTATTAGRSPPGMFQMPPGGAPTPPSLPLNPPSASPPFAAVGTAGASPTLTAGAGGKPGSLPHPAQSPSPLLHPHAQHAQHQHPYVAAAMGGEYVARQPTPSSVPPPQQPWDDLAGYNPAVAASGRHQHPLRRSVIPSPQPQPPHPPPAASTVAAATAASPVPGAAMTTVALRSEEELAAVAHRDYVELQRQRSSLTHRDDSSAPAPTPMPTQAPVPASAPGPAPAPAPATIPVLKPKPALAPAPVPASAPTPAPTPASTQEGVEKRRRRSRGKDGRVDVGGSGATMAGKGTTKKLRNVRPVEVHMDVDDGSGTGPQRIIRVFNSFVEVEKNLAGISRGVVSKVCNKGGGMIKGMHFRFFIEDDQNRPCAESGGAVGVDKGTRASQQRIQPQKRRRSLQQQQQQQQQQSCCDAYPNAEKGAALATVDHGNEALSRAVEMKGLPDANGLGHNESAIGTEAHTHVRSSHVSGTKNTARTLVEAPGAIGARATAAASGGERIGKEKQGEDSSGGTISAGTGGSKSSNATGEGAAMCGGEAMPDARAANDDGVSGEEKMSTVNMIRDQMFQYMWPSPSVEAYNVLSRLVSICQPPGHGTGEVEAPTGEVRGNEHGIPERFLRLAFGVCDDGVPVDCLASKAGECDGRNSANATGTDSIASSERKKTLGSISLSEHEQENDMWRQIVRHNPKLLRPSRANRNLAPRILVLFYDRIRETKPRPRSTQLLGIAYVVIDSSPLVNAAGESLDSNENAATPGISVYPLHAIQRHCWENLSPDFSADTCDGSRPNEVVTGDCNEQTTTVTVDRDAASPLSREGETSVPNPQGLSGSGERSQDWSVRGDPEIALGSKVFGSLGSWIEALLGRGRVYSERVNERYSEPGVEVGLSQSSSPWWLRHLLVRVVPGMYRLSMPIGPTAATKLSPLVNNVDVTVQPSSGVPEKEGPVESFPNDSSAHAVPNSDTRAREVASFDVMSVPVPSPRAPANCRILAFEQASIVRWMPNVAFPDKGAQSPFFREEKSDQDQDGTTAALKTSTSPTNGNRHFFQIGLLPLKFFYKPSEVNDESVVVPVPSFVSRLILLLSTITEVKSGLAGIEQRPDEDPPHEEQQKSVIARTVARTVIESTVSSKDDNDDALQQNGRPALRKNGQDRDTIVDVSVDNASSGDTRHIDDHVNVVSEASPEEGSDNAIVLRRRETESDKDRRETESDKDAKPNLDRVDEELLCDEVVAGGTAETMHTHQHVIDSVSPKQQQSSNMPSPPDNKSDRIATATCPQETPDDAVPVDATKSRMTASTADQRDVPTAAPQLADDQSTSTIDEGTKKSSLSAASSKTLYRFRDILLDVEKAYAHIDKGRWDAVRQFDDIEWYKNAPLSAIWTASRKMGEPREDVAEGHGPTKPKPSCASDIDATQTATQKNCTSSGGNGGGTAIFTPISQRDCYEKTTRDRGERQVERTKYSFSPHPLDCGGYILGRHLVWDEGYYSDTEKGCLVRDDVRLQATTDLSSVHDTSVDFLADEGNVARHGDDMRKGERDSAVLPKVSGTVIMSSSSTLSNKSQQCTVDVDEHGRANTSSSKDSKAIAKAAKDVLNRGRTKNGTLSAKASTQGSTGSVAQSTGMQPAVAVTSDAAAGSAYAGVVGMATRTSSGKAYKNSVHMSQVINELASGKLDPHTLVECEPYKLGPELRFARSVVAATAADNKSITMTGRFFDADKAESHRLGVEMNGGSLIRTHGENGCKTSWQSASQTRDSLPARYRKQVSDDAELLSLVVETLDRARTKNTSKSVRTNGPQTLQKELFKRLQNNVESIQPFSIRVSPDASFLIDLHVHLVTCEVIGFLGGKWVPEEQCIYVQAAFPCKATDRCDSGETDVEMDPVSQVVVKEAIAKQGLMVCGWYHSHPKFRPDPSVTDIDNQANYQRLMQNDNSSLNCSRDLSPQEQKEDSCVDVEDEDSNASMQVPFVGLIVGTYGGRNPTPYSVWNWFHVTPKSTSSLLALNGRPFLSRRSGGISSAAVVNFPRKLDATTRVFRRHVNLRMRNGRSEECIRDSMTQNGTHSREQANLRDLTAWKRAQQGIAETPSFCEDYAQHIATATSGSCSFRAQTSKRNNERKQVEKTTHGPRDAEGSADASNQHDEGRDTNGSTRVGPEDNFVEWSSNRSQEPDDETNSKQRPNKADQSRNGIEYGIPANALSAFAKGLVLVGTAQSGIESTIEPKTKEDQHEGMPKCSRAVENEDERKQTDPRSSSARSSDDLGASIISLSDVLQARRNNFNAKLPTGAKNKPHDSEKRSNVKVNGKKTRHGDGSEENTSNKRKWRGSENAIARPLPFSRIELDRLNDLDKLRYCQPDRAIIGETELMAGREEGRDGSERNSNPTDPSSSGSDAEMEIAEIVWNAIEREQWRGTKGSKPRDIVAVDEGVVVDSTSPSQNSTSLESQEDSADGSWIQPSSAEAIRNRLLLKYCRGTLNRFQSRPDHRKACPSTKNDDKRDTYEKDLDEASYGRVDDATIVHGIDAILHYYASNPKRVNMNDPWSGGGRKMSKGAKLFTSILRWAKFMHVGSNSGRGPADYSNKLQIPWDDDEAVDSNYCDRSGPSPDIDLASEAMRLLAAYWREASGRPKAGKRRRRRRK